ncbi:NfeD family protein [Methanomassiliicoccales archaeon LGM-DZ1]|nr:NfeD family protein [Methanomassiliicoccales archaeon LGM-DZ1]
MEELVAAVIILAFGLILLTAEAFFPGGYLLIPGGVLVIVGAFGLADQDDLFTWVTAAVAIVAAVPVTAGTIYLYKRLGAPEPPSTTVSESLVGKEGVVTVKVTPDNIRGKVKIGSDTWSADSDEPISAGTKVIVDSSEGVHVHVVPKKD